MESSKVREMEAGYSLQFIQLSDLSLLMTDRPQEREKMAMTGTTTLLQKIKKKIIKGEKSWKTCPFKCMKWKSFPETESERVNHEPTHLSIVATLQVLYIKVNIQQILPPQLLTKLQEPVNFSTNEAEVCLKTKHNQKKPTNRGLGFVVFCCFVFFFSSYKLEIGNRQSGQCRSMQDCSLQHCFLNKASYLILSHLTNAIFGI